MWWFLAGFLIGETAGMLTAAIVEGSADRYMEWRKQKNEQKRIRDRSEHHSGSDGGAGRDDNAEGKQDGLEC